MRKPNGYGSIKHLNGRRRRPFVFVVSKEGRQRPVAYFATQVEAEIFAADYNKIHRRHSLPRAVMHRIRADGHTTHDCRHTVSTLLDNAGANETAKRRILGHAGGDITERVYTHKGLRQLRKCIELLK